jgi:hypothetical protein
MRPLSKTKLFGGCVGLLLLALITPLASAANPKRVLILNPFGRDVALFSTVVSVFLVTLAPVYDWRELKRWGISNTPAAAWLPCLH